jgi:hypothetical protein
MKYKQRCGQLQKDLDIQIELKQKYQKWWREAQDRNLKYQNRIFDLERKVEHSETSKLKLEVEMLKEIVGLYKRIKDPSHEDTVSPQVEDRCGVTSSSIITPNITTSSTTSLINGFGS